jgi:isopentenyl diphosphate isomerase/L-lactate dehydrogenase-like FMN-dependent dehydrogenase
VRGVCAQTYFFNQTVVAPITVAPITVDRFAERHIFRVDRHGFSTAAR